jgi:hypothetical protein
VHWKKQAIQVLRDLHHAGAAQFPPTQTLVYLHVANVCLWIICTDAAQLRPSPFGPPRITINREPLRTLGQYKMMRRRGCTNCVRDIGRDQQSVPGKLVYDRPPARLHYTCPITHVVKGKRRTMYA